MSYADRSNCFKYFSKSGMKNRPVIFIIKSASWHNCDLLYAYAIENISLAPLYGFPLKNAASSNSDSI
jgi:hypothetical protein